MEKLTMPRGSINYLTRRKIVEWSLLIAILALIAAFFTYIQLAEVDRTNAAERDRLHVLSGFVANDIEGNLVTVNHGLEGVIHDYFSGPGYVESRHYLTLRLQALEGAIPGIRALLVIDVNGLVTFASKPALTGKELSYRDYFKTTQAQPDKSTLYISAPFQSLKQEPDMVIAASRMIPGKNGEFAGMVVAILDKDFFADSFTMVVFAPDVWAFVVHGDGRQMYNFPEKPGIDGTDLNRPETLFSRHRRSGQIESVIAGRVFTTGEQRLMVLHTIQPNTPHMDKAIVIGLSRDLSAISLPLQRRAADSALLFLAILLFSSGVLYWMQTRRARIDALRAELERERVEADERLQVALRGANLGLWGRNLSSGARWSDDNSYTMLGFAPQIDRDDPEFFRKRLHPEDLSVYQAAMDRCVSGSEPLLDVTFRIRNQAEQWVWMQARARAAERDGQGVATKIMGTYLDVSAAKAAEQDVARARDELQAIFDNMSEAVLVLDSTKTVVRANRRARSVHGLFDPATPLEEVWSNIDVCLPSGEALSLEEWPTRRGFRGDFVRNLELEIRRKDTGKNIFIDITATPVRDASNALMLLIMTYANVTDRKTTDALRFSEARFRTLIEDAPLAIAILRGGYFIYTNPRYRNLHGYLATDDLTGRPWSAMISPESRAALHEQEALIIKDSATELMFEAQGYGKEGRLVPVFKTTARVMLVDGPATMIFAQDISAQKSAEMALLQARDAAEAASRSKADFLANMSHEIRSPLNAILGLAYLLEQTQLNADAHNMVRKIRASGRMLLGIINDILDVSKIEAGHMTIEQAPFRLDEVIDNLATTMGIAVGDKNVELIIHSPPPGISSVLGDALRLEQVLSNLASNAIKFTEHGRVELSIKVDSRSDACIVLRFSVQDTGIGIAPELQSDVFSAFTQADSSTTRRFGGTGLGLTICRRLVNLMGGEIGLRSELGKGSEFWFTLPLGLIAGDAYSSPDMVRIDALVADASEIELQAILDIARGLGWQAKSANSGEAVLSQLLERKDGNLPNVVVLDWNMPGMDGIATARAIRGCMPPEECPIVIMAAAYSLKNLAALPGAEAIDAILSKPVTASTLYNATIEAQRKRAAAVGVSRTVQAVSATALDDVRLLVVDDSEINREVAQRILSDQGASVTLACDGQEALNWLLAHPDDVDLVLMDVQMPVMDGVEATRKLRMMPQFNDLPIVALTAGVFKEQQEIARAAGMTHFVTKPFDVPSTIALIQRLKRRGVSNGTHAPDAALSDGAAPLDAMQDSSAIDVAKGLRIWSDVRNYRDYLRRFVDGYGNAVAQIETSLAANDRQAAAGLAHKLAGVAANMSLPETHRTAIEAERVLVAGHDHTLILSRLDRALQEAIAAIERFAPMEPPESAPTAALEVAELSAEARSTLRALLLELLAALDLDNPESLGPILNRLQALVAPHELAAVRKCASDFDFRGAEACVAKLAALHDIQLES
jgi:PAS domain S-box-containing protein